MSNTHSVHGYLTPEQAKRAVMLCWKAGVTPNLVGGVGLGKSSIINELHESVKSKGVGFYKVNSQVIMPEDIGGYGVPNKESGRMEYYMPSYLPFDSDERCIIFPDELDRGTPEVQNVFTQLILDKQVHGHKLSPNSMFVTAMNGESDVHTTPLSKALTNRLCHLHLTSNCEGWEASYKGWLKATGNPESLAAFVSGNTATETFEDTALLTPRSAVMANDVYEASETCKFNTKDIIDPCIAGLVGWRHLQSFKSTIVEKAVKVTLAEILKGTQFGRLTLEQQLDAVKKIKAGAFQSAKKIKVQEWALDNLSPENCEAVRAILKGKK